MRIEVLPIVAIPPSQDLAGSRTGVACGERPPTTQTLGSGFSSQAVTMVTSTEPSNPNRDSGEPGTGNCVETVVNQGTLPESTDVDLHHLVGQGMTNNTYMMHLSPIDIHTLVKDQVHPKQGVSGVEPSVINQTTLKTVNSMCDPLPITKTATSNVDSSSLNDITKEKTKPEEPSDNGEATESYYSCISKDESLTDETSLSTVQGTTNKASTLDNSRSSDEPWPTDSSSESSYEKVVLYRSKSGLKRTKVKSRSRKKKEKVKPKQKEKVRELSPLVKVSISDFPSFDGDYHHWIPFKREVKILMELLQLSHLLDINDGKSKKKHCLRRQKDKEYDTQCTQFFAILHKKLDNGAAMLLAECYEETKDGPMLWAELNKHYDACHQGNKKLQNLLNDLSVPNKQPEEIACKSIQSKSNTVDVLDDKEKGDTTSVNPEPDNIVCPQVEDCTGIEHCTTTARTENNNFNGVQDSAPTPDMGKHEAINLPNLDKQPEITDENSELTDRKTSSQSSAEKPSVESEKITFNLLVSSDRGEDITTSTIEPTVVPPLHGVTVEEEEVAKLAPLEQDLVTNWVDNSDIGLSNIPAKMKPRTNKVALDRFGDQVKVPSGNFRHLKSNKQFTRKSSVRKDWSRMNEHKKTSGLQQEFPDDSYHGRKCFNNIMARLIPINEYVRDKILLSPPPGIKGGVWPGLTIGNIDWLVKRRKRPSDYPSCTTPTGKRTPTRIVKCTHGYFEQPRIIYCYPNKFK